MQLVYAQKLISDAYNVLSCNEEYSYIKSYMCNETLIHDSFWPLHKKLCSSKENLRDTLNHFSEAAEKTVGTIYEIKSLIERDKINKKGNYQKKIAEKKAKLLEEVKLLEEEEEVGMKTLPQRNLNEVKDYPTRVEQL